MKKTLLTLIASLWAVLFTSASTVDDLTAITTTCVYAFDDYTGNGTGTRSAGSLFGGNHFLDVNGGTVSTGKKSIDIADLATYVAINGVDTVSLAAKYTTYGSHLNSLRLKNTQDVIALKPIAGSVIYLFGYGNNKEGTAARIPLFAADASFSEILNEAPDESHPASGTYVYKFEVPEKFDGTQPLYIGSYNGDVYCSFVVVEVPSDDVPLDPDIDVPATSNYGVWDFTKGFSDETVEGLIYDSQYWGCWYKESDTRMSPRCEQQTLVYYSPTEGIQVPIKETEGLKFGGSDYTYLYIEHGLSRPCLKFNKVNITVTIPGLSDGMLVTIVTKTGNSSSERGIVCTSGNAVRVSGAEVSTEEITNIFKVTCAEGDKVDVTFQPYVGGISIFSIEVTEATVESALENLNAKRLAVDAALAELDSLGLSVVAQELKTSYENDSVDETSLESIQKEVIRLDGIIEKAAEGQKQYNNMLALVVECDTLVMVNPSEELSGALATAKLLLENVSTATINDIEEGYNTLKSARNLTIVRGQTWEDWNFSIGNSNYISIDGNKKWYLDTTNKLAALYSYDGNDISVPEKVVYKGVEYIVVAIYPYSSYSAFSASVTSIELPRTLRYIDSYSFEECDGLQSMIIPENVYNIGAYAFSGCDRLMSLRCEAESVPVLAGDFGASNLRTIYVPAGSGAAYRSASYWKNYIIVDGEGVSVTVDVKTPGTLGDLVLAQVENLSDVNNLKVSGTLNSDDIYNIQNRMSNLLTIDLAGTDMTALPDEMFYQRYALQQVVLPVGLKSIGERAFYQCYSLQNVEFPATLTTIGIEAFNYCYGIKNLVVPEGVTSIGEDAFGFCDNLQTLQLPTTLSAIPGYMCSGASKLETVVIPEGVTSIGLNAFRDCSSLKEVVCPSTLTSIGNWAFLGCTSLSSVSLNEGLTTMGQEAFNNCDALTEFTLPSTLNDCDRPFAYSNNLKAVTCLALLPPGTNGYNPIYGVTMSNHTLYVPAWTINRYKQTVGWDQFPNIKPLDGYWPENITVQESVTLSVPDTLPADYKPNLRFDYKKIRDSWGTEFPSYGSLSLSGENTLSIGEYRMCYDVYNEDYYKRYGYYDYGAYGPYSNALVNNATMRADSVAIRISLPNDRWIFLSFPFDVKVSDIEATDANTNYVIRKYSGADRAAMTGNTWQNMTVDSILHAGEGYIWQCNREDGSYCTFVVSAINNVNKNLIFANETRTIALNEYQSEFSHNRSWNLIGNPFPCYYDTRAMDFTAPITAWDILNNTYVAYSPIDDDYILRPGEAFFVQCPVDVRNINFSVDGRQTDLTVKERIVSSGARSVSAPRQVFNIYLSNGSLSDHTRFVINAKAEMNYNMSHDAGKFMSNDAMTPQLFTIENGVHYAINERPMGNGVIALGTYFGSEGTYTLALDTEAQTEVILVDKLTGKEVNLAAADYTFFAEAGTVTDRFEIKLGGATSVEGNVIKQVSVQAVGGQIVVNGAEDGEAVVYTTDGKQIATVKGNAALEVAPGLYIVKVQGKSYKVSVVR